MFVESEWRKIQNRIKSEHCEESVGNRSFFGPHFPASSYSVRMPENEEQNNPEYGHFLRSRIELFFYVMIKLIKYRFNSFHSHIPFYFNGFDSAG